MRSNILSVLLILGTGLQALAQAGPAIDVEGEKLKKRIADYNQSVDRLRNLEKTTTRVDPNEQFNIFQTKIRPLYRVSTAAELALLAPDKNEMQAVSGFLSRKNTGMTKLVADRGCNAEFMVAVAGAHCEKYSMPGSGSSYSFRNEGPWLRHMSDINFDGRWFQTVGETVNGILVNIGDVDPEKVDSTNPALQTVSGFAAPTDLEKASALASLLKNGIGDGKFVYRDAVPVKPNSTYLLRSIAYRGDSRRMIDGVAYNEFEFDERKDVTVIFRVVSFIPGDSVTIAWQRLERKDAPYLRK